MTKGITPFRILVINLLEDIQEEITKDKLIPTIDEAIWRLKESK